MSAGFITYLIAIVVSFIVSFIGWFILSARRGRL